MPSAPLFSNRTSAGEQLAEAISADLAQLRAAGISAPPLVYALPRGGIPIAVPVARQLGCPLDIVVAKKITKAQNPELAIGAVTADGHILWAEPKRFRRNKQSLELPLHEAQAKAQALQSQLSPSCLSNSPKGTIAILIDDGIATGMTMAAAACALRAQNPELIWICVPVAPAGLAEWLHQWSDHVIVLQTPHPFLSVSRFYEEFPQVETEEVISYLQLHNQSWLSQPYLPPTPSGG